MGAEFGLALLVNMLEKTWPLGSGIEKNSIKDLISYNFAPKYRKHVWIVGYF